MFWSEPGVKKVVDSLRQLSLAVDYMGYPNITPPGLNLPWRLLQLHEGIRGEPVLLMTDEASVEVLQDAPPKFPIIFEA